MNVGHAIKWILLVGVLAGVFLNEWVVGFAWGGVIAYVTRPKVPSESSLALSPSPEEPPDAA